MLSAHVESNSRSNMPGAQTCDGQASQGRVRGRGTPPPAVDGVPGETAAQTIESFVWTIRRRPARYIGPFAALFVVAYAGALIVLWGLPWWMQLIAAAVVLVVAFLIALWGRAAWPGRRTYASSEARMAVARHRRGWYIADHIAQRGTRGAGHRLRLRIRDQLIAAADAQQIVVFAHTTSEKLAHAYMEDIPGLRIASTRGDRILLVRPPRRHLR